MSITIIFIFLTDKIHILHTLQMYKNMLDGTSHQHHHMHPQCVTNIGLVNVSSLVQLPLLSLSSSSSLNRANVTSNASSIQNNTQNGSNGSTSVVDRNNKNGRLIIAKTGIPHAVGRWEFSEPRITVAYNIMRLDDLLSTGIQNEEGPFIPLL